MVKFACSIRIWLYMHTIILRNCVYRNTSYTCTEGVYGHVYRNTFYTEGFLQSEILQEVDTLCGSYVSYI